MQLVVNVDQTNCHLPMLVFATPQIDAYPIVFTVTLTSKDGQGKNVVLPGTPVWASQDTSYMTAVVINGTNGLKGTVTVLKSGSGTFTIAPTGLIATVQITSAPDRQVQMTGADASIFVG